MFEISLKSHYKIHPSKSEQEALQMQKDHTACHKYEILHLKRLARTLRGHEAPASWVSNCNGGWHQDARPLKGIPGSKNYRDYPIKPQYWQWHHLNHIQIICTSLHIDNQGSTSPVSFLQDGYSSSYLTNSVTLKIIYKRSHNNCEKCKRFFQLYMIHKVISRFLVRKITVHFLPNIRTYGPQILVRVLPTDSPQVRILHMPVNQLQ